MSIGIFFTLYLNEENSNFFRRDSNHEFKSLSLVLYREFSFKPHRKQSAFSSNPNLCKQQVKEENFTQRNCMRNYVVYNVIKNIS